MLYPGSLPVGLEWTLAIASLLVGGAAVVAASSVVFTRTKSVVLSMVLAVCFLEVVAILGSEALSAAHVYSGVSLFLLWWVLAAGAILGSTRVPDTSSFYAHVRVAARRKYSLVSTLFVVVFGVVCVFVLITGLFTAPNNIDSLNYHLPRIMQWLQAGKIGSFVTPYSAQIWETPGAEEIDGILLAALRTDHGMFLAQWVAWISMAGSVYFIASRVGRSRRLGAVGAIVALLAPLFIGEAATTQTDLIATSFVMAALAVLVGHREFRTLALVAFPILVGTAATLKPTDAVFAIPMVVWYVVILLRPRPSVRSIAMVLAASAVAVLVNYGWASRNIQEYGSISGPDTGLTVTGSHFTAVRANVFKNLGLNLAVPGGMT